MVVVKVEEGDFWRNFGPNIISFPTQEQKANKLKYDSVRPCL